MQERQDHDVHILGRQLIEVTGITAVDAFDVHEFQLTTRVGAIVITGRNLHMKHLNLESGVVRIEGTVVSLQYADPNQKSRLSKFFR